MIDWVPWLALAIVVTAVLIRYVAWHPEVAAARGGRVVSVLALLVLPIALAGAGASHHLEKSKSTTFCMSCHVMEPYGRSLLYDSADHLPARHYQNRLIPREQACYICHSNYAMFGDLQAKLTGARHLWVNYVSGVPGRLELYRPYRNRECFRCHGDARSFLESGGHEGMVEDLQAEAVSCLDCHGPVHAVHDSPQPPLWRDSP